MLTPLFLYKFDIEKRECLDKIYFSEIMIFEALLFNDFIYITID